MDALVLIFDIRDGKVHYKKLINAREKKNHGDENNKKIMKLFFLMKMRFFPTAKKIFSFEKREKPGKKSAAMHSV